MVGGCDGDELMLHAPAKCADGSLLGVLAGVGDETQARTDIVGGDTTNDNNVGAWARFIAYVGAGS